MERGVWVVETKGRKKWFRVSRGYIYLKEAREEIRAWEHSNPNDLFRITEYTPKEED